MLRLLLLLIVVFIAYRIFNWTRNYSTARSYGLPILLIPVSFQGVWWMPLRPLFAWVKSLPFGLGDWYLYTTMGWPTEDGNRSLLKYGENFVLCSPSENIIVTAQNSVVEQVWTTRAPSQDGVEWYMPGSQAKLFAFYGENVSSTNGEAWKRHRKITGSAFNERTVEHVWDEAVSRAARLELNSSNGARFSLAKVRSTLDVVAMQILTTVGFGQETDLVTVGPGHKLSLMDSLGFVLENIMLTILFNSLKAPDMILPKLLRKLKLSVKEFKLYMEESVLRHFQAVRSKPEGAGGRPTSLLEAMIRANETGKDEGHKLWLTDSELYGNIFVFNLAGYETTSSTFTFALSYLAAYPEIQEWVREEIDIHYTPSKQRYTENFPKLVRTLAIMYETLRLASHTPMFVKTPNDRTTIRITTPNSSSIEVNPGTLIGFNNYGAHLSPKWGQNPEIFDPTRFIANNRLVVPENVLYLPWMAGPRVCPGKKFSQVEFVGLMADILKSWRVETVRKEGESEEMAREKLLSVLDEKYFHVSCHLKRPGMGEVRFVRRF
ncbi:Cytochrome P450 monooxygenase [Pseudocercospora fuligena]|uniref:Cytochrome P450 monooxygenase n=1 Tax=Pseudocercospora fuligena TaxID=685502 RepID=A0A8H6RSS1_9PEZI|nr:Cytochrome P450 monooxygenase [Pseudocercospora fuligena]